VYWCLFENKEIKGLYVFVIAVIDQIVNLVGIKIFHKYEKEKKISMLKEPTWLF
jgi:Co/Zn/Cd efflux system component